MSSREKQDLKGTRIGIELLSGKRLFGLVDSWTQKSIFVIKDGSESSIEVPREIIVRALIVFDGGKK